MKRTAPALLALASSLALTACGGADAEVAAGDFPDTITLAGIPAENSADLRASYEPVIALLERETGSQVEFVQASDYAGVVEGMIAGNVDIAFFGPFAYVVATVNGADISPLGAVVSAPDAVPGYRSYGLARSDNTTVNSINDFAGKDVCFVDPGSTSGFLYPTAGLIDAGIVTSGKESAISEAMNPVFAGAHDASALAIKNGDCDAGFAFDTMVDKTMVESGDLQAGELKTVWESELIAGSVFAARNDLSAETVAKLRTLFTEKLNADYMLAQGLCEGECRITDERAWGVKPASDTDYDGVREVCALTESDKCEG